MGSTSGPRVFVLGHRGMLGHVVRRFLGDQGCDVRTTETRYAPEPNAWLVREVRESGCDAVVNCIGLRSTTEHSGTELFAANGLLPQHLAMALGGRALVVHASSDGVFTGRTGAPRRVDEPPDADDPYGASKRLGELCLRVAPRVVVLRCSIVGPELGPPRSILGWFLSRSGSVDGFTDHRWNGVTTLEWARLCWKAISGDASLGPGLHQPACTEPLSKRQMLVAMSTAYDHPVEVRPRVSGTPVDRVLWPTHVCGPFDEQLRALYSWYLG